MWNIGRHKRLLAGDHVQTMLQGVTITDRAFAFEQIGNRLDALVIMDLCTCTVRDRLYVHADFLSSNGLCRGTGSIGKALLADIRLARFHYLDVIGVGIRHFKVPSG